MNAVLHHVGVLTADIPQAAGQYAARFGYRPAGEVCHDAAQGAHIQMLDSPFGGGRIELIAPDGPRSQLHNALRKGAGLHHLCYESADLERDCRELTGQAMLLLHGPMTTPAFPGQRIAWLMGRDGIPIELLEAPTDGPDRLSPACPQRTLP